MQSYGVNFTETWAPTAAARSVRLVISIAAMRRDRIKHIDIKSAYLNAKLSETVYIQPPAGYTNPDEVWLLSKALYGLKQAGRENAQDHVISFGLESDDFRPMRLLSSSEQLLSTDGGPCRRSQRHLF